jgi:hypothetical protein
MIERDKHIATSIALSLGGELLPPHYGNQQHRWRWLRGQFPIPVGCQNKDFCPPKLVFDDDGAAELFVD